jgi:hypothetical protein
MRGMPIDDETQAVVRALWAAGAAHGRPPSPVPEADPWDDDVPGAEGGAVVVELGGVPDVVVRLHRDRLAEVQVEGVVELEVPRADVAAVVEALLAGRARRRPRVRGVLAHLLAVALGSPAASDLEVTVGTGAGARTYTAPVSAGVQLSGWVLSLPVARA